MELERATVKGKKTSYSRADGEQVVKYSKTVNLGVNSVFSVDDDVVVIAEADFNELVGDDSVDVADRIADLTNIIGENENRINSLLDEIAEVNEELMNLTNTNSNNLETINQLTSENKNVSLELTELKTIMKQYNINSADDLNRLIIDFRVMLNYLMDCLTAYREQGRISSFLKRNPTLDIGKPSTLLIDFRGNMFADGSDEFTISKGDDPK